MLKAWLQGLAGTSTAPDARIDLSESADFFIELLDDTSVWRERLVQEVTFASASQARVVSGYQIDFPPDLVERHVPGRNRFRTANVLLPLATRPKGDFFKLDFAGPGGNPVQLTARASIAGLERLYLRGLVESSPAPHNALEGFSDALLEAICVHTPALFRDHFMTQCRGWWELALAQYLNDGLGLAANARFSPAAIAPLLEDARRVGRVLASHFEEPPDPYSSSEQVLLALPRMDPRPRTKDEVADVVRAYSSAVESAHQFADHALLIALADYGRRFEVIVEVEVPLLEPSTIKLSEDRPLKPSVFGITRQRFALGEARSAHFEAHVIDPNVVIGRRFALRDPWGYPVGYGWVESISQTPETLSVYSSERGRPYYVDVAIPLRLAGNLYLTMAVLVGLNLAAFVAVLQVSVDDTEYVEQLALLSIPTTLAAAFVLVREQTALAARLQNIPRVVLSLSIVALWIAVLEAVL